MYDRDIETHLTVAAKLQDLKNAISGLNESVFGSWPANSQVSRLVTQLTGRMIKLRSELKDDYSEVCDAEDHARHGDIYSKPVPAPEVSSGVLTPPED